MKFLFLCGGLEPGHDGVGDYTRRLAIELIRQGNQASAIALNDQSITELISTVQSEGTIDLTVLRIPSILNEKKRFEFAKKWIGDFNPDVLSLQFVPFSFHPKGLSLTLKKYLEALGEKRLWHIMFHELWVGMGSSSNLKLVYWGKFQRWLIKSLILKLKPIVIHTQTKLYQLQLTKMSINTRYLPLFSNIPANSYDNFKSEKPVISLMKKDKFVFVLFGAIYPGAPVKQFAEEVSYYAKKNNMQVILKIVGRSGVEQKSWETIWKSTGLIVELFGEQSAECVSDILKTASMGISTTPIAIVEKSGTAAAMKEHGLPVICVSNFWKARGFAELSPPHGIVEYQVGNLSKCLSISKTLYSSTVSRVGHKFVDDLQSVVKNI